MLKRLQNNGLTRWKIQQNSRRGWIMKRIEQLLDYVRKTNPNMDRKQLIEELSKSRYSAIVLIITWQNSEKTESLST